MAVHSWRTDAFLPLKPAWFHILVSLSEQECHGYGIMRSVRDRTRDKVRLWPTTLYGALKRMIESGLIEPSTTRPAPEIDDSRRQYYRLTTLGRAVLDAETARLEEMVRLVHAARPAGAGVDEV